MEAFDKDKISWQGILFVILATACWSTSGILINLIVAETKISPVGLAFWRDISTFVTLIIGITIIRPSLLRVRPRDLPWLAGMGAISIGLFHVFWVTSVVLNGAAIGTVIQCNAPIFVTFLAWAIWREPINSRKIVAIVLSIIGTLMIANVQGMGGVEITLLGVFIGLASAVTYGTFSLFGKKLTGDYNPWTIMVFIFGFGALMLLPFQFGLLHPWPVSSEVLSWFTGLILISTIMGFGLYTTSLVWLQASVASITATTEVPFAAMMAYVFLNERLNFFQVLGALCVIGGVILVSLPNRISSSYKAYTR